MPCGWAWGIAQPARRPACEIILNSLEMLSKLPDIMVELGGEIVLILPHLINERIARGGGTLRNGFAGMSRIMG